MATKRRGDASSGCKCVYLTHERTGANVTPIKWCETHRPRRSLTGRPHGKEGK